VSDQRKKGKPRPASTYRGAKRNARRKARAKQLAAKRAAKGATYVGPPIKHPGHC
jgi:hypothetical protein